MESATQAAEAIDVVELRKLCQLALNDLHELLWGRCLQEQLKVNQAAREVCEAGLGLGSGLSGSTCCFGNF